MRTSDSERRRAVAALRRHCADGRLDLEEFEQRVADVLASRTTGELDDIFADLPELTDDELDPAPPAPPGRAPWRNALAVLLLLVGVAAIAAAVVTAQVLWAAVLAVVWAAGMAGGALRRRP